MMNMMNISNDSNRDLWSVSCYVNKTTILDCQEQRELYINYYKPEQTDTHIDLIITTIMEKKFSRFPLFLVL